MTLRLSLSQKTILISAAARPDGNLLPISDTVMPRGKALDRTVASLIRRDFVLETTANAMPGSGNSDDGSLRVLVITPAGRTAISLDSSDGSDQASASEKPPAIIADVPLPGGKLGVLLQAVSSEQGATLGELVDATNWLGHTARAALTHLRQRGFDIRLEKTDGRRVYRLHTAA